VTEKEIQETCTYISPCNRATRPRDEKDSPPPTSLSLITVIEEEEKKGGGASVKVTGKTMYLLHPGLSLLSFPQLAKSCLYANTSFVPCPRVLSESVAAPLAIHRRRTPVDKIKAEETNNRHENLPGTHVT